MQYDENHTKRVAYEILNERVRQVKEEYFLPENDDKGYAGRLLKAAYCYLWQAKQYIALGYYEKGNGRNVYQHTTPSIEWPFDKTWWKPKDPRRDLIKTAALIIAEIERIDRTNEKADD